MRKARYNKSPGFCQGSKTRELTRFGFSPPMVLAEPYPIQIFKTRGNVLLFVPISYHTGDRKNFYTKNMTLFSVSVQNFRYDKI